MTLQAVFPVGRRCGLPLISLLCTVFEVCMLNNGWGVIISAARFFPVLCGCSSSHSKRVSQCSQTSHILLHWLFDRRLLTHQTRYINPMLGKCLVDVIKHVKGSFVIQISTNVIVYFIWSHLATVI